MTASYLVLVPVKSTSAGKSRLALPPVWRVRVARAMALDTVTAAAASSRVWRVIPLVEDDADGAALDAIDKVTSRRTTVRGLNEAIRQALSWPEVSGEGVGPSAAGPGPVAALPADLPSLRPQELDTALIAAAAAPFAVVADRQGTGTTLLAARRPELLRPHYGPGSFAAHLAAGAAALPVPPDAGLRCDVDVLADLAGVSGRRTRAVVDAWARQAASTVAG